jgi:hypothetical protein
MDFRNTDVNHGRSFARLFPNVNECLLNKKRLNLINESIHLFCLLGLTWRVVAGDHDQETRRHFETQLKGASAKIDQNKEALERFGLKIRTRDTVCYLLGYKSGPKYSLPSNPAIQKLFNGKTESSPSNICLVVEKTPANGLALDEWKLLADSMLTQKRANDKKKQYREAEVLKSRWEYVRGFVYPAHLNSENLTSFTADVDRFGKTPDLKTVSNAVYLDFSATVHRWESFVSAALNPKPTSRQ